MPQPAQVLVTLLAVLMVGCGEKATSTPTPTDAAARGERAFFETLSGAADRNVEAVGLLEAAVAQNERDGRSQFLLGMVHLLRFYRGVSDPYSASDVLKQEIAKAQDALDTAVPLLPKDRRVPGFRGAATYLHGVVTHDDLRVAQGLTQMREAIEQYSVFNTFAFIGAVAPVVDANDPLYREVMQYVGTPVTSGCNPFTMPEICGNAGKAPHNIEGSLLFFGDLFAKAGDERQARSYYRLAQSSPPTSGGTWPFAALAAQRLEGTAQRVALYQDDNPANDPKIVGYGRDACAICHYK